MNNFPYLKCLKKIILPIAICHLLFAVLCGCQNRQLYKESCLLMGTLVEVISPDKQAAAIVFAEIEDIENLLSKYRQNSEVSQLNQKGQINASQEMLYIMQQAKKFWLLSDGAFDISVGPLVDIWGFTDKNYTLPEEKKIKKIQSLIGQDKIIINEINGQIRLSRRGMKVDLGAIAKGFAIDCAVKKLLREGITSCLINAGGDIYCLGDKFGKPWNVAIASPRGAGYEGSLKLKNRAVATSGDYEQYFIVQQKKYSHILDPKTGYPADSGVVSVTVIASDCLTADALATSIFVLGKKEGLKLIDYFKNAEVKIIEENDVPNI